MTSESTRLLLVTGAGASRNLGKKDPLPLMNDWARVLRGDLDKLADGLSSRLGLLEGMTGEQFETILGQYLDWERARPLVEQFLSLSVRHQGEVRSWFQECGNLAKRITETIRETVFREFGAPAIDTTKARAAYGKLFDLLKTRRIVVATTNYDYSVTYALEELGFVPEHGFKSTAGRTPILQPQGVVQSEWSTEFIPVLNLHGAVGWYRTTRGIEYHYSDQPYRREHGVPALMLPDPSKDPLGDANVSALWAEFRKALRAAHRVLIIGHSLHDRILVKEIQENVKPEHVAIGVRDPSKTDVRERYDGAQLIGIEFGPEPSIELEALATWWSGRSSA